MKLPFKKKIIIYFFFLSFLFFSIYFFHKKTKETIYSLFSPLQKFFFKTSNSIYLFFETISQIKNLKNENEILKAEIKKLIAENENLKTLKKENEELRKALGLSLNEEFNLILANFVAKDIVGDVILIDKGEKNGVKEGQVVILPEKILVGKVIKVFSNFSKVRLFTDKDFTFDVEIPERNLTALCRGLGNFEAQLEFLPKEKEIFSQDQIITSALGGKFPKGILVGRAKEIKKSDVDFYQTATIEPYFEVKNFSIVFVISNF